LREALAAAQRDVELTRQALRDAEDRAARNRRVKVDLREARDQLRALAELALRHLGDRCPVCDQLYDRATVQRRLEGIVGAPVDEDSTPSLADEVANLAIALEGHERARSEAEAALRRAEQVSR